MKHVKYLLVLLACCCCSVTIHAQVSFVFVPEVQGRTIDGLLQAKLINTGTSQLSVRLTVTVTGEQSGKVVSILTPSFSLLPGTHLIPPALIQQCAINFGTSKTATVLRQAGFFPADDYEYCFAVENGDKAGSGEELGEQCFDYALQPFSPLLLITPAEGEAICDKRPSFFWQPMMPAVPGVQYRLFLTEVKAGQATVEAMHYNLPIINQLNINGPFLFFPPSAPALLEGKQYAWQVTAYSSGLELANSEIWTFTEHCTDSVPAQPVTGYRDIADLSKANFYVASGSLHFAVRNIYDKTPLQYTITGITQPDLAIKKLPVIVLTRGLNDISIDLQNDNAFQDGNYYLLSVKLPTGETKQLRFQYKNAAE